MKLAVIVSQFPELHETFILKELLALREAGIALRIFSLKTCRDRIVHPEAWSLLPETEYVPLSSGKVWGEVILEFLNHPIRTFGSLKEPLSEAKDLTSFLKAMGVYVKSLALAQRARREKVTHLHAHWATFPTTAVRILSRLLGIPYSFTGHAWDLYVKNPTLEKKIKDADFVVTCTEYNRRFLTSLSPKGEGGVFLNYHGVDLEKFPKRDSAPQGEEPLLLSVGRLVETKGFLTLLQSFSLLKERKIPFQSVIVGEGPLHSLLEGEIRKRDLQEVHLAGSLSRNELYGYYKKASLLVVPSEVAPNGDRDGIPNVLTEAMAVGVPVIATEVSGIPEVVSSGSNGLLVPEKDPLSLAEAIASVLKDPRVLDRLGEAAHQTILERFEAGVHLGKLAEHFREKVKIKVLYIIWSLEKGGAERVVVSLAEGLDRKRFQPMVCCLNHPGVLAERLTSQEISVFPFNKRKGIDVSVIPKLVRLLRREKVHIVHTHLWGANVWGRLAAFFAGVPVTIAAEHGIQEWRGTFHRLIDRILSYFCHCIVFVADEVQKEFCRTTGVRKEKCLVIPNGIDTKRFAPSPDKRRWRKKMGFPLEEKIVLSVGRLVPEKRCDLLLKAFNEALLREGRSLLWVVGGGEHQELLQNLKASLKLDGRVQFLGEKEEIEAIYQSADLFVQSSGREALSLAMLEAMATELPVIVSAVGDHPRIIRDGENGFLVPVGDLKALTGKIAFVLSHPEEARRLGEEARRTVLAHYSKERMIRQTQNLYEELLHA